MTDRKGDTDKKMKIYSRIGPHESDKKFQQFDIKSKRATQGENRQRDIDLCKLQLQMFVL